MPATKLTLAHAQVQVLYVQRQEDGSVVHFTSAPLPEGAAVIANVDWGRRYDLMQQHTGASATLLWYHPNMAHLERFLFCGRVLHKNCDHLKWLKKDRDGKENVQMEDLTGATTKSVLINAAQVSTC